MVTASSTLRNLLGGKKNTTATNASRAGNLAASTGLYSKERTQGAFHSAKQVQDSFAEMIPGVGQVYSGGKAITAYNPFTGQPLSWFEVSLAVLGAASGGLGDEVGDAARNVRTFRNKPTITASVGAPRSGEWLSDAMKGFRDGEIIPDSVLERLSSRLRNNTRIIKNEWAQEILEKTGDGAQFMRFKDGSAASYYDQSQHVTSLSMN